MDLTRRSALAAATGLLALPVAAPARAAEGRIVMASWGGGGARMWRETFMAPFTKATGIEGQVSEVPDPAAAIVAAQGRPQYNTIIAASYQAANLALRNLVEELTQEDLPAIRHVPEKYWIRNAEGKLLGMPIYFIYYGIAYNTAQAKASDFTSWKSLADPKWRDQVSITRPLFLAPYDLTLFAKLNGGDETNIQPGIPLLQGIARNAVSSYTSMAQLQQQLATGEVTAAPFYSGQVQMLRQAGQKDVAMALPQEGGLILSYVLAIPRGAQDKPAALRFLNSCIDPAKQISAARSGYLPLTDNVTLPPEIEKDLGLSMQDVLARNWAPNWYTVAGKLEERMRLVEQVVDKAR